MTDTAVKNASAILTNVAPNAGKNAKGTAVSGSVDFQSVWNNQMGKSAQNKANAQNVENVQNTEKAQNTAPESKKPEQPAEDSDNAEMKEPQETVGKSEEPKEAGQPVKVSQTQPEQTAELSPEEMEAAMETLGMAVLELMQRIADIFGISMEELQGRLEELGMNPLDLLKPADLGEFILKLGGAEDSLALLTDENLCGSYKAAMEQMEVVLNDAAKELQIAPEQLETLLSEKTEKAAPVETVSEEVLPDVEIPRGETLQERIPTRPDEPEIQEDATAKTSDPLSEDIVRVDGAADKPDAAAENRESGEKQSGKKSDSGQQENLFAQEFKPLQPETGLQQTQGVEQSTWNEDTQDIMRQIMDYMKLQMNADTTNLEMQLHPASLGTLHIQVEAKAGVITASFITQNEAVKAALESQIVQLKENFEEQGVKVEAIEVTVQSHAFERNLDQGREQNQGSHEPSRKARVRRINLNDLSAMEDMEEEDVLAADMLAAGGSTVDYTA